MIERECVNAAAEKLSQFGRMIENTGKNFSNEQLARMARAYFLATTGIIALRMELDGIDSSDMIKVTAVTRSGNAN